MEMILPGDKYIRQATKYADWWYGTNSRYPQANQTWTVQNPWTKTAAMRRDSDGEWITVSFEVLLDKRIWKKVEINA